MKSKKKKKKKKRKKLQERTWAHFILMKSGEEGEGVLKQIKSLQVEQKEKERKKKKGKCTYRCEQTLPCQAQVILTATRCWNPLF